jgi:hypothetical protein
VPACGRHDRIDVRKDGLVDAEREPLIVESHTGSGVAEEEEADDRDAIAREIRKRPIEPLQPLGPAAQSSVRKPETCADIRTIPNPGKIDAEDEAIRFLGSPHSFYPRGFAGRTPLHALSLTLARATATGDFMRQVLS